MELSSYSTPAPGVGSSFDAEKGEHRLIPGAEPFIYEAGPVGCLMLHGYTASPFEMRGMARYLADRGITAGAALLAGHGTSPEDLQGKTWHDWLASANAALDEMLARCRRVYLAGLSLGGALTLYIASQRGADLAGIIPISAPIFIPQGLSLVLRGLQGQVPYLNKPYRDIEDPVARAQHISYVRSPSASTASLIEFVGLVRGVLPQVKAPALVIYARHDHVVPGVSAHHIYSRLGSHDKRLLALHRGYHIATIDTDRQKLWEAVGEFAGAQHTAMQGRV